MNTLPVPATQIAIERAPDVIGLLRTFFGGCTPRTFRAYRGDLADFTTFVGSEGLADAARILLAGGLGAANGTVLRYRIHLIERGLAPASVNRRLAALRSLVRLARTIGVVAWSLEVPGVQAEAYRNTSGPGVAGVRQLLSALNARRDAKGLRDLAMVRLMFDLALRRGEVVSLDVIDLHLEGGTLDVLGKGRSQRTALSLPGPTREALRDWLVVRGSDPGPLFVSFDRGHRGQRLSGTSLYRLVRQLGATIGLAVRPHGLRHTGITQSLELSGGDLRRVQRYSRHRDVRTIEKYDDNRKDLGGELARQVADSV